MARLEQGLWYDLLTEEITFASGPAELEVDAPLEKIPVYVKGGSILPFQEPALTTEERWVPKYLIFN